MILSQSCETLRTSFIKIFKTIYCFSSERMYDDNNFQWEITRFYNKVNTVNVNPGPGYSRRHINNVTLSKHRKYFFEPDDLQWILSVTILSVTMIFQI